MATLIQKELNKDVEEPASKRPRTATASFWQATAVTFQKALNEVVQHAKNFADEEAAAAFPGGAFAAPASSIEEASGRVDGSPASLQSGEGNLPLHWKLHLAHHLGSFNP